MNCGPPKQFHSPAMEVTDLPWMARSHREHLQSACPSIWIWHTVTRQTGFPIRLLPDSRYQAPASRGFGPPDSPLDLLQERIHSPLPFRLRRRRRGRRWSLYARWFDLLVTMHTRLETGHAPWMAPQTHETCPPPWASRRAHKSTPSHVLPSRTSTRSSSCPTPLPGTRPETQRTPSPRSPLPLCALPPQPPSPFRAWTCAECPVCRRSSCNRLLPFANHIGKNGW